MFAETLERWRGVRRSKYMKFVKITDPKKRKTLVRELSDVKCSIRASNLQHRLNKLGLIQVVHSRGRDAEESNLTDHPKNRGYPGIIARPVPVLPLPPEFADTLPIEEVSGTTLGRSAQYYLK